MSGRHRRERPVDRHHATANDPGEAIALLLRIVRSCGATACQFGYRLPDEEWDPYAAADDTPDGVPVVWVVVAERGPLSVRADSDPNADLELGLREAFVRLFERLGLSVTVGRSPAGDRLRVLGLPTWPGEETLHP